MRKPIQLRLKELRDELQVGRVELHHLEVRRKDLIETMLRIEGAITALEELLSTPQNGAALPEPEEMSRGGGPAFNEPDNLGAS